MHERTAYVLHRRASLDPREVEQRDRALVEVRWYWGDALLGARHLRAGERFVASSDPAERSADLCVEHRALGGDSKVWVCIQERGGRWWIALPPALGASEPIAIEGEAQRSFWLGAIEVRVRGVRAGRAASRAGRPDRAMLGSIAGAAALALASVGLMRQRDAAWWSNGGGLQAARAEREAYVRALVARSERWSQTSAPGAAPWPVADSQRAAGLRASGALVAHPQDRAPRRPLRAARWGGVWLTGREPRAAADVGVFRALGAARAGAAINPFGGLAESPTIGWGASGGVADAFGFAGLGGGATSAGAGEASGTCGCAGGSTRWEFGAEGGLGPRATAAERARRSATSALRTRGSGSPRVCGGGASMCAPIVVGHYPSEAIRRVVRANIGQVQRCFEQALALDAEVEGRVAVRFVLSGVGSVLAAAVESNSTGSAPLGACVARVFTRLQFAPPPDGLAVTVTYPVQLQRD